MKNEKIPNSNCKGCGTEIDFSNAKLGDEVDCPNEKCNVIYVPRKKEKYEFWPVKKWHTTNVYQAAGCGDLPVCKLPDQIVSVWKQKSLWERVKFLFHGEITFSVWGQQQPPIGLSCGDIVQRDEQ